MQTVVLNVQALFSYMKTLKKNNSALDLSTNVRSIVILLLQKTQLSVVNVLMDTTQILLKAVLKELNLSAGNTNKELNKMCASNIWTPFLSYQKIFAKELSQSKDVRLTQPVSLSLELMKLYAKFVIPSPTIKQVVFVVLMVSSMTMEFAVPY